MTEPSLPSLPGLPPLPGLLGSAAPAPGTRPVVPRTWQRARVVEVRAETATVSTFRLHLPEWTPHLPGQHYVVRLTAPDGYRAQRSYSVASPPEQVATIDLAVERLPGGEVSGFLHDGIGVGDELEVRGPLGGWFVWDGAAPALLVGGGTGVVPLMAMLRSRRARGLDVPLPLVVSARGPQDLLYADELASAPARGEVVHVVLTRSVPPGWPRAPGRLRPDDLLPHVVATGAGEAGVAATYVCGSAAFAGGAERVLAAAGADPAGLRVERFGPT